MATLKSFPYYEINVEDRSIYEPVVIEQLPLHRPHYYIKAQKGIANVPVWYPRFTDAERTLGKLTFDPTNKTYFSPEAMFLLKTFPHNGAFISRYVPADAKTSFLILEAKVKDADIVQYQKDAFGNRILDQNGNPIPREESGSVVTEPGIEIEWAIRTTLNAGETLETLQPVTDGSGATTYPIMVFEATSPGLWGNNTGFSFYYDPLINGSDIAERVDGVFYTLAPIEKPEGESIPDPVRDKYNNVSVDFVFKPDAIDSVTQKQISMSDVIANNYDSEHPLPYRVIVYYENIETIGDRGRSFEDPSGSIYKNGYWINIVSCMDLENRPYDHIVLTTASEPLVQNAVHYLAEGDDGSISDNDLFQEGVQDFYEAQTYPEIQDKARYPITHVFDPGYNLDTKKSLLRFLDIRDDVKVIVGTFIHEDYFGPGFTVPDQATDESVLRTLNSFAALMKESIIKGTECCRATIFTQAGVLYGPYKKWMTPVLWSAIKHAEYQNIQHLDRVPEGRPFAEIDIFEKFNWVPFEDGSKQRLWDLGGNYCQYYDMEGLHYASVRSVYPYSTSVLVNDVFTDAIVYMKHIVRYSWSIFAGMSKEFAVIKQQVESDLTTRLNQMVNGKYKVSVLVYQTEEEQKIGFIYHVQINVEAPATMRVWIVDIICNRENYEG